MKKSINILAVSILLLVVQQVTAQTGGFSFKAAGSPSDPKVAATWNKYYTYEGITDLCNRLVKAYPGLITMESAGKSYEGREMIVLTITDKSKGSHISKPAYWVDGNIHGNEIQGTEMALYTAWYLCEMYGRNEFITDLLAEKTIYIAPTINPDARAVFTGTAGSLRSGVVPRDDDRDGLVDEDGFDDLNGDGEISMMRRKTTDGNLKSDPSDPRKMVPVAPGEKGDYEIVGREGIDNDGDGLLNEDGPGSYDPNRDWGYNWEPNYVQNGADKYPFSLPETRAIRDFITSHPNITGSQSFHNSGGMILKGPSVEGGGSEIYSRPDDMVYESIGRTGEKIIPGYRLLTIWKDMYTVWGGELDWMYGAIGSFVYSNELWTSYLMFYDTAQTDNYEFDRLLLFEDAFIPWEEIEHPVYGKVEVGGFSKSFGRLHPGFMLETDAHRNMAFVLYNAWQTPKLEVSDIAIRDLGGGLREITATVNNRRMMPTHSAQNMKYHISAPDYITLEGAGAISALIVTDPLNNITREQKKNPQRIEAENIPGYGKVVVRWIASGKGPVTVTVNSVKGGNASATSR
jgi:hypothetical protein